MALSASAALRSVNTSHLGAWSDAKMGVEHSGADPSFRTPGAEGGSARVGRARRLVSAAVFAVAVWLVWRQVSAMSLSGFLGALAATPAWAVLLSVAFTAASYACLSGTEWLALRALGHDLSFRRAAAVAVPAYAITNSAGFSPATGAIFRAKLYGRDGLSAGQGAAVSLVAGLAVTLSGLVTAGLVMLLAPAAFGAALRGPAWAPPLVGAALALPGVLWFYAFTPKAPAWLGGGRTSLRRSKRALGLSVGLGDWLFSSAALFILLPGSDLAVFPTFLAAYVAGSLLSAATGVPGGIGVFEAIVLALSAVFAQVHETAAALLLYRCVYSLGPLAIWGGVVLIRTWRRRRSRRTPPAATNRGGRR